MCDDFDYGQCDDYAYQYYDYNDYNYCFSDRDEEYGMSYAEDILPYPESVFDR